MLSSLVSPTRFGILLAIVLVLAWRWTPRSLRVMLIVPLFACMLLTTPWCANLLVHAIESRVVDSACVEPLPATIVVLGGGMRSDPANEQDTLALAEGSLRRTIVAAGLQREDPQTMLVISGGAVFYAMAESRLMANLAERLGVPRAAMRIETESRSTWQNAQQVAAMQPPIERRIRLVTSNLHMPRARYAFEQAGFDVCAVGAGSIYAGRNGIGYFLPSTSALEKSDAAIHELLGDLAYRAGWLRAPSRSMWSLPDER